MDSTYCEKISKDEYEQQSKDYTMAQLKELQSQLQNFKPKAIEEDSNVNSDLDSDADFVADSDADYDEDVESKVIININKNNKNNKDVKTKPSKNIDKEKDNIITHLIKKTENNNKRIFAYSNKIKQLKKEKNETEECLHYLKLNLNNLTIDNDSLKKELKEKNIKIDKFCEHFQRKKIEMFLLKFIVCILFFTNLYCYFS